MKHYFEKKAHTKDLEIYWQMFRHFRNVVSYSFKIAKRDYCAGLILENKNKPKLMWKYLKELLSGNAKPSPKGLLINGQIITDPKCMSTVFNNYFTSIGQELASKLPPAPHFTPPENPEIPAFTFPSVTSEFVQKQLQKLPENKAIGLDRLPGIYLSLEMKGFGGHILNVQYYQVHRYDSM